MTATPSERSEAFGELIGLVEMKGLDPDDAVEKAVSEFGTVSETEYRELATSHWPKVAE